MTDPFSIVTLLCYSGQGSNEHFRLFDSELSEHIPVVNCSIADTRIVGRLCCGNRRGLLMPNTTTDQELQHVRNSLPDKVILILDCETSVQRMI